MADMVLRRASDGYVLSNRVSSWTGWRPYGESRTKDTITGVPQTFDNQSALVWTTEITCTFAPDSPGSTELNYREIVRLMRNKQLLRFTDLDGVTTNVRVKSFSDRAQWEEVKHKTIFDVTFSVYDPRPFY